MLVADKGLVIENRPSAEAASFSSKDRFGGCSDKMPGRKTARGFAGEFYSIQIVTLERASSCDRPPWLMSLHARRLAHRMHGCKHGSVGADNCSLYDPLVLALVVCDQGNYFTLCGRPESAFYDPLNVYG